LLQGLRRNGNNRLQGLMRVVVQSSISQNDKGGKPHRYGERVVVGGRSAAALLIVAQNAPEDELGRGIEQGRRVRRI
jgi:hypothetical protein